MLAKTLSLLVAVPVAILAIGCAAPTDGEDEVEVARQMKIIGANDLVVVKDSGANIPEKYRALIDGFGILSMGCTATHIGDGMVLSAGHCFNAPSTRRDNVACPNIKVKWGFRADSAAYMESQCEVIRTMETNRNRDYAILKVNPAPPVALEVDFGARPDTDTSLTIFGHPRRRALEWSQVCLLQPGSVGGWGLDQFSHQCDTEPGSSGSTILDDTTLRVIGIHDGGTTRWNYGTYLTNTPIAEFVGPNKKPLPRTAPIYTAVPREEG